MPQKIKIPPSFPFWLLPCRVCTSPQQTQIAFLRIPLLHPPVIFRRWLYCSLCQPFYLRHPGMIPYRLLLTSLLPCLLSSLPAWPPLPPPKLRLALFLFAAAPATAASTYTPWTWVQLRLSGLSRKIFLLSPLPPTKSTSGY